ncbi:MAG TPA: hypothetical protein VNI36_03195 [Candidatus Dormibacteraeota bacterium]|nr:hypothetical protein [Candidatus Dormibacteraeota bacterium]
MPARLCIAIAAGRGVSASQAFAIAAIKFVDWTFQQALATVHVALMEMCLPSETLFWDAIFFTFDRRAPVISTQSMRYLIQTCLRILAVGQSTTAVDLRESKFCMT